MSNQSPQGPSSRNGAPQRPGRTPLVGLVAAAAAVALVCAAVVVALVLTLGGDDESDGPKDDTTTAESPTTDEPPDETTTPTPDAHTVVGTGYSYRLPGGWSDVADDLDNVGPGAAVDTVSAWGAQFQNARANFIVTITPASSSETAAGMSKEWKASMRKEIGAKPEDIADVTINGQPAVGIRFERKNDSGVDIVQIAYLVVNDSKAYTLGMSTTPERESDIHDAFGEIVDSWAWD